LLITPKTADRAEENEAHSGQGKSRASLAMRSPGFAVCGYLLPAFGDFALVDITDVAVKRLYKKWRGEEYAPATIGLLHVILSSMFKAAESADLILRNPMRKVKAAPQEKPKPVAMNAKETQKFLDAASARPERFMFLLAYHLGARPCEYLFSKVYPVGAAGSMLEIEGRSARVMA
jgi:integrase